MFSNFSPMNVRKKFGSTVRARRNELGMSQEDLAAEAELDRTYVSGIERGLRNPTLEIICRIAAALEEHPGKLLESI